MTLSTSSPRARRRWLLLAAIVAICTLGVSALALATPGPDPTPIPAGYTGFTVTDEQGANDVPGQVDLTQMGRDDSTATTYKLFWSWDSISSWTGTGQTGDACALFDTDTPGNTFIDFVVCVRVENFQANASDVRILSPDGVFAFSCTDKKNDRCTNPTPVSFQASQVQAGALGTSPLASSGNLITHSDPFPAGESYNHDSTVEIHILKDFIPLTEVLVNVCSYPSAGNGGNNNPFDCIVSPGGGFLQIVKDAGAGVTSPNFTFDVNRPATLLAQKTIAGSGTAALIPILVDPNSGPNVVVTETNINSAWQLTAAGCTTPGSPPVGTGTFDSANNRVTGVSIKSGTVTTCTFTDRARTGSLTVIKTVVNDNGGTATAGQFTYTLGDGSSATNEPGTVSPGLSYVRTQGTTYAVAENAGGPAGYSVSYSADCTGAITATTKTCTITNNDNAPALHLRKTVTNDNGGAALATAWTLTATGTGGTPTNLSGSTPVDSGATFKADTYTLAETGGPASGYTAGSWSCVVTNTQTPVAVTNSQVAVGLGANVTCTINNDDTKAQPAGSTIQTWVLRDSISITGIRPGAGNAASANVIFRLYDNANCTGDPVGSETDSSIVSGAASTSTGVSVAATGFYYWTAQYSGDDFNLGFTTGCGDEVTQIQAKDAFGGGAGRNNLITPT